MKYQFNPVHQREYRIRYLCQVLAVSTSSKVAKNRSCVAMRRPQLQTRSTGAGFAQPEPQLAKDSLALAHTQLGPLLVAKRGRLARPRLVAQACEAMGLEARHPALHRPPVFPNNSATCWQRRPLATNSNPCKRWSYRDPSDRAISCWMASRMTSASAISSVLMTAPPHW